MIYTVTLNPAIDKTVVIENLTVGGVNRVSSVREDAGGKGINVSKCLKNLGAETVAAMVLAGTTGKRLSKMLEAMKIPVLRLDAQGENRTNLKIIDPVKGENTDINETGPKIDPEILEQLKMKLGKSVGKGDIVVLSGSLPAGIDKGLYGEWIRYFRSHDASVLLDADGEALYRAIDALPYMIKPNETELAALVGKQHLSREEMIAEGKRLHEMGIPEIVISLGSEGALLTRHEIADRLKSDVVKQQLNLLRLRNTCPAFGMDANLQICSDGPNLYIQWKKGANRIKLSANLQTFEYCINEIT